MKAFLTAAATAALLAIAGPVSAQMYGSTTPPADYPGHERGGGPQWQWMVEHGSTTNDALPYGGNDLFSDELNERDLARARRQAYRQPSAPEWEPR